MPLFYQPEITVGHLSKEESGHASRVLRLTAGDEIQITDGRGNLYKALIREPDPTKCKFEILAQSSIPRRAFSVHLAIAPTKNADRMEWMVEKCVEVGIEKISFITCKTSERKTINLERFEKIIVAAMKQSQQAWLPVICELIPFREFITATTEAQRFIAHVDSENPHHLTRAAALAGEYLVLIGPEGDFSLDELALAATSGYQKVSLGPHRLRTETAGLAAVMMLNMLNLR